MERAKNTAIPDLFGVGWPAIALYMALRKRFLTTALLATDLGATAAALNVPGTAKNFAEIRLFCPLGKNKVIDWPFCKAFSTSEEVKRLLLGSMN